MPRFKKARVEEMPRETAIDVARRVLQGEKTDPDQVRSAIIHLLVGYIYNNVSEEERRLKFIEEADVLGGLLKSGNLPEMPLGLGVEIKVELADFYRKELDQRTSREFGQ